MITALYRRNIQPGTEYNDLIPDSVCHSTFRGDGDTFHSMDLIQEFIEDYSDQVSKLAPLLKGSTVKNTVKNIYDFLYNHIQYKADGAAQEIRSPQCTWHSRSRGADCKSFTVFAGALCKELGIPFSIRKIQQPGDSDGKFSHVYIIVHQNNKPHLVIDATKHENTESFFIKKHDISMKHYGLNASSIASNQKQCAFQDYFGRICNSLSSQGVCNKQINSLKNNVNDHIKKTGHYPLVTVNVDTVFIGANPHRFRNKNGATIMVARKHEGLSGNFTDKAGEIAKNAIRDNAGRILSKAKSTLSRLWKSITCSIRKQAWSKGGVERYANALEAYLTQALDKLANTGNIPGYYKPNNLGVSKFNEDLDRYLLEFWSLYAKYNYQLNNHAKSHNSCTRGNMRKLIEIINSCYNAITEVYTSVLEQEFPLQSHEVLTKPLMDITFDNRWTFAQTLKEKGSKDPVPQIKLPRTTTNPVEYERLNNPTPNIPRPGSVGTLNPSLPSGTGGTTKPGGTSKGFATSVQSVKKVSTGNISTSKNQKAGFGVLPALLIAAAGYGVIKSQSNKKKK